MFIFSDGWVYNPGMLVFIDDAGDPGFQVTKGSSSHFVISLVIFDDELEAEKSSLAIKELRRTLKVSDQYEFKFNKTNRHFRLYFMNTVLPYKFRVRTIVVNKDRIRSYNLKQNKEKFYNYIIMQVLKNHNATIRDAKLKFDSHGEKILRDELRAYLSRELNNKEHRIFKSLKFVDSQQNTLIQLSDMVSGSVLSKFSGKDGQYFDLLMKAGKFEDVWEFQ